jgi:hypothetical protein
MNWMRLLLRNREDNIVRLMKVSLAMDEMEL